MFHFDTVTLDRPTAVLTERGECVRTVYRLLAQLRQLGPEDRADIRELLETELNDTVI